MEGGEWYVAQDGGLHNFFETGDVSGAGVEANKTPSSGGQVCIFFFHGWVKLLPLGHPINHLESKEENWALKALISHLEQANPPSPSQNTLFF